MQLACYACCIAAPPAATVAAVPTRLPYRPYSAQSPPSCSDAGGRREKDPSCTPRVDNHHCRGHGASRHRQCGAIERTGRERLAGLRPDVQRRPLQSAVADQCLHRHAAGTRLVAGPGLADGYLHAYSARTGKDLWSFFCGVAVTGVPIAYRVGDNQYITITSGALGGASAAFGSISARWGWDPRTHPRRLLTFALDASAKLPPTPPRRRVAAQSRSLPRSFMWTPPRLPRVRRSIRVSTLCATSSGRRRGTRRPRHPNPTELR